jgi:hypothetical protein
MVLWLPVRSPIMILRDAAIERSTFIRQIQATTGR